MTQIQDAALTQIQDAAWPPGTAADMRAERPHLGERAVSCTRMPLSSSTADAVCGCCGLAAWRAEPPPRRMTEEAGCLSLCQCTRRRDCGDQGFNFLAWMQGRAARCVVQPRACRAAGAAITARLHGCWRRPWQWLLRLVQAGEAKDQRSEQGSASEVDNAAARSARSRPDGAALIARFRRPARIDDCSPSRVWSHVQRYRRAGEGRGARTEKR